MTDKQIIIDGVPVQDCCYFDYENDGYEDSCYIHQNECSAQNCYYKQLKAKEQECEELKKQLMQKSEVDMFFNTPLEGWSNDPCGICPYKAENETYKKMLEDEDVQLALTEIRSGERHLWYNKADKLSKTLTEIKVLSENVYCLTNALNRDMALFAKEILKKISEVEDGK